MKPEELRIGNYIETASYKNHPEDKTIIWSRSDVVSIYFDAIHFFSDRGEGWGGQVTLKTEDTHIYLRPIPLTEQWLKDFGFKEYEGQTYTLGRFTIDFTGYEGYIFYNKYPYKLKCVHQLQNLYYAITGKELTK